MTAQDFLQSATHYLEAAGIGTARLDALILLEHVTNTDRTHLLAHPEFELTNEQAISLEKLVAQRAAHIPLAYLRGVTEFYGREFSVTPDVLEPRPESETMIDLLKGLGISDQGSAAIIDVGTGSGALAITAKLELPEARATAIDIDQKCLNVAQQNAQKHKVDIDFIQSDLLESAPIFDPQSPIYILANLPYVPDDYQINEAAMNEPHLAIFGGPDGLDLYRRLFQQLAISNQQSTYVLTEAIPFQHEELTNIARAHSFALKKTEDFIQVFCRTSVKPTNA